MNRQSQAVCEDTCPVSEPLSHFRLQLIIMLLQNRMTFKDKGALVKNVHAALIHIMKAEGDRSLQALKKKVYDTCSMFYTHTRSSCSFNRGLIGHLIA